jgi:dTDP-4-dehydrorhamnose 3,5-epimerase
MHALPTGLPGVLLLEPKVFGDARGFFMETYNTRVFAGLTGCDKPFVQDNHSRSARGVLRGLHYQLPPKAQDKLVRVVAGEILDVAVDIRRGSKTFGKAVSARLSADNRTQMWVPAGFAHGFVVLSDTAEVIYKVTDYWSPPHERGIRWDDPALGIDWQLGRITPALSPKDAAAPLLADAEAFP